jgi:hypothetical protein
MNPDTTRAADSDARHGRRLNTLLDRTAAGTIGRVVRVECRTCGFEPTDQQRVPHARCPKCQCTSWERFVRSDSIRTAGSRWTRTALIPMNRRAVRCLQPCA